MPFAHAAGTPVSGAAARGAPDLIARLRRPDGHAGRRPRFARRRGDLARCPQDRYPERPVGRLRRTGRPGIGRSRADRRRGLRRGDHGPADRDPLGGPPEQAGARRLDRAGVDRGGRRRRDRRRADLRRRARGSKGDGGDRHRLPDQRRGELQPDRGGLFPDQRALGLRYLFARHRHGACDAGGRAEELVLPHRRRRLRHRAAGGGAPGGRFQRRRGPRPGEASARQRRPDPRT